MTLGPFGPCQNDKWDVMTFDASAAVVIGILLMMSLPMVLLYFLVTIGEFSDRRMDILVSR